MNFINSLSLAGCLIIELFWFFDLKKSKWEVYEGGFDGK